MDQKKIGSFMKELRKGKKLTQEQIAEQFEVSNRTVSRWENGYNIYVLLYRLFSSIGIRVIISKKRFKRGDVSPAIDLSDW